jgi:hypothetical protein
MKTYPGSRSLRRTLCGVVFASGLALSSLPQPAHAQGFSTGSDGSLGDVIISENTTLPLPPDGKLHFKTLTVSSGARLKFQRNARNTPVYILAQGDVVVAGIIDVRGAQALVNNGGVAGPGGFDGGMPGFSAETPPGNGYGPGAGVGGTTSCDANIGAGGGSYGTRVGGSKNGLTYGSPLLIPLVGGSGGAGSTGQPGGGGGGGGGAILIASSTRVLVSGAVEAIGGNNNVACLNSGSGGAIRLVAPKVEGSGRIDVRASALVGGHGGLGRIRVDTIDRSSLALEFRDNAVTTVGGNLIVFPPTVPRLDTIEVAGNEVPPGSDPVLFILPFGTTPERTVKIQARDFGRVVPIRVVLTPDSGLPVTVDAEIDNTTTNPAVIDVPVTVPVNTQVTVHSWTR